MFFVVCACSVNPQLTFAVARRNMLFTFLRFTSLWMGVVVVVWDGLTIRSLCSSSSLPSWMDDERKAIYPDLLRLFLHFLFLPSHDSP